jgi:SAM-dependent methyltransferase
MQEPEESQRQTSENIQSVLQGSGHLGAGELKQYWDRRASLNLGPQSTTMDVYMREVEIHALLDRVVGLEHATIADIGCGDGRTTAKLAARCPEAIVQGADFSPNMLEMARQVAEESRLSNLSFREEDVGQGVAGHFDVIVTTRCLINLPSWDLQRKALRNIHAALNDGGHYLMVENFLEGHANMNRVRSAFGLPEIAIRDHNLFFDRSRLLDELRDLFEVIEEVNISSSYYLVTRVIYSKLCLEAGRPPDYFDAHHRLAANLPFSGEFGPVRLLSLKKR